MASPLRGARARALATPTEQAPGAALWVPTAVGAGHCPGPRRQPGAARGAVTGGEGAGIGPRPPAPHPDGTSGPLPFFLVKPAARLSALWVARCLFEDFWGLGACRRCHLNTAARGYFPAAGRPRESTTLQPGCPTFSALLQSIVLSSF